MMLIVVEEDAEDLADRIKFDGINLIRGFDG